MNDVMIILISILALVLGWFITTDTKKEIINYKTVTNYETIGVGAYEWWSKYTNVYAYLTNQRRNSYLTGFMRGKMDVEKPFLMVAFETIDKQEYFFSNKGHWYTLSNIWDMKVFYSNYFRSNK